ncbi:MAG: PEP-CTERM sorting domain-containing protein [Armatimonadota bacterium]
MTPKRNALFAAAVTTALVSGLGLAAAPSAQAQVSFNGTYTQNFDTLLTTGGTAETANPFTDNSTLPGWYASETAYFGGPGTGNAGGLYSFGAVGNAERALGSIGSNATGTIQYGVQLQNTSGSVINSLTVSYTGEQWRNGGNATAQTLSFAYFNAGASNANVLAGGAYTGVAALNFTSLQNTTTAAALNGNAAANSTALSSTITNLNWQAGQYVWLRWTDPNDAGNDHGLAIDSVTLSAAVTPPVGAAPEPGSLALVALGAVPLIGLLRRRTSR